ncbi:Cobalt-factor III methyltransferase [Acaryochloris thomasi RCC1774]|uniref:Cobalt-factor III methyltransferase n=1 Tax=Acaryochloris thomasi RCC1774 TaxID=1764569 RepID=A0A2W1JUI0_9CYAN|nr:precorrin-3B C(17)-methyltransferase [Acaryochloris thomasi]PZD72207.1 Cobalt-factor III methyltransferase [Acaryochloris thomasi RCC1774]
MSQSLFEPFQPLVAIATTPQAATTLQPICQLTGAILWVPETLADQANVQVYSGSLRDHLATLWPQHRGFIFGLATGAVVRLIAPLLEHKSQDPAVLVVEEQGQSVISLCSGHLGHADQLTRLIASQIGATSIITGTSTRSQLPSLDLLGQPFGWQRGAGDWNQVSGAIARQQSVAVVQESGSKLWQAHLPAEHPFVFADPPGDAPQVCITHRAAASDLPIVRWHPRVLWVGIGCERGTSRALIEQGIEQVFREFGLAMDAIASITTLDLKADEAGLLELCQDRNWPLQCFAPEVLRGVEVPTPSEIVAAEVGTPSVAEAAALYAAQVQAGSLEAESLKAEPATLIVPKQIIRNAEEAGAATVAIALSPLEFTGRQGRLYLVGTGPGSLDQMTPAAQTAIVQADAVIGYSLYMDLVQSRLRPGQMIETYPITQERQRAQRAIALANWGLTVAMISSGDAGIYGMAGLVLEELELQNWDGRAPAVEIFPGVSALQAAASRVGTPLMHDFCAISLSDRLTPWEVIEKRLQAAAAADFVTALYNPRSQLRVEQLTIAQTIMLEHRDPNTPVAVVRSAYREDEATQLTTLGQLHTVTVDMLTTVLIGNGSTHTYQNWMITPRGYLNSPQAS